MAAPVRRLLSSFGLITGSRLAGAALGFLTQIALARILSTEALGEFFFATSLAAFLAILAAGGFPGVTARFLIRYRERRRANLSALFLRTGRRAALLAALALTAAAVAAALLWPGLSGEARLAAVLGCAAAPAAALCRIAGAAATAYRRFNLSFLPDLLLRPLLFLAGVLALRLLTGGGSLAAVLVLFAALLYGQAAWQSLAVAPLVPAGAPPSRHDRAMARIWLRAALPLVGIALFTAVFADLAILFAGFFLGRAELAVFGVAVKITLLVGFALNTAYQVTLPDLAEALRRRAYPRLRRAIALANLIGLATVLAALLAVLLAGQWLLALFGPEFAAGKGLLAVLLLGQLATAAGGPAVQMLTLTDRQAGALGASLAAALLLLLLDAALIPAFGLAGAAAAVVAVNLGWAAAVAVLACRATGVRSDAGALAGPILRRIAPPTGFSRN